MPGPRFSKERLRAITLQTPVPKMPANYEVTPSIKVSKAHFSSVKMAKKTSQTLISAVRSASRQSEIKITINNCYLTANTSVHILCMLHTALISPSNAAPLSRLEVSNLAGWNFGQIIVPSVHICFSILQ